MDLMCTPEEEQISQVASEFFATAFQIDRLRHGQVSENHHASDAWQEALQIGLFAGGAPVSAGGSDLTLAQVSLIFRECGRHLVDPAALALELGLFAAVTSGDELLAQSIARGEVRVGLSNALEPVGVLQGPAQFHLIDAAEADLVLVWTSEGAALYRSKDFADVQIVRGLDGAVPLARAFLPEGVAPQVRILGGALALRARILISAMLVGIAEATRDMAVNYAQVREQFGKTIGSFQAIKHFCADMATRVEAAYAQVVFAALSSQSTDAVFQSQAAQIVAIQAAELNALKNIQVHGGIGFTAECNAHLYLKRTHLLMRLQGGSSATRGLLLEEPAPIAA